VIGRRIRPVDRNPEQVTAIVVVGSAPWLALYTMKEMSGLT
jgi:hypothetical protein